MYREGWPDNSSAERQIFFRSRGCGALPLKSWAFLFNWSKCSLKGSLIITWVNGEKSGRDWLIFQSKKRTACAEGTAWLQPPEFPRAFIVRELAGRQHYGNTVAALLGALLLQVDSHAQQIAFALSHGQRLKQRQGPCMIGLVSGGDLRERRDSSGCSLGTEQLSFPQPNPLALLAATGSPVLVPLCPAVALLGLCPGWGNEDFSPSAQARRVGSALLLPSRTSTTAAICFHAAPETTYHRAAPRGAVRAAPNRKARGLHTLAPALLAASTVSRKLFSKLCKEWERLWRDSLNLSSCHNILRRTRSVNFTDHPVLVNYKGNQILHVLVWYRLSNCFLKYKNAYIWASTEFVWLKCENQKEQSTSNEREVFKH